MKIVPSGLIDSITQTSGGTTIQNSYGGLQLHRKAYQVKKRSITQQEKRMFFAVIQSSWRALTPEEQDTWIEASESGQSGFNLYSDINNRMLSNGMTPIPEYVTPVVPDEIVIELNSEQWSYVFGSKLYQPNILSPNSSLPASGWTPYIQFFPWLKGSQYSFRKSPLIVPQSTIISFTSSELIFRFNQDLPAVYTSFEPDFKGYFKVDFINETTGQVDTVFQYETIAPPEPEP